MKKLICLLMVLCLTVCVGCNEIKIKEPQQPKKANEEFELKFINAMTIGNRLLETDDLISTAEACKAEDLFTVEEMTFSGELSDLKISGVGTASGQYFAIGRNQKEDTLYNISGKNAIELYRAEVITPIFEKDGDFVFAVTEKEIYGIEVMKYDLKEKSISQLFYIYGNSMPIFTQNADYISVIQGAAQDYIETSEISHYRYDRKGEDIKEGSTVISNSQRDFVRTRNIKNNYFMTYDYGSSQILVNNLDTREYVSEISVDVWSNNDYLKPRLFGSRLFMRDINTLNVHDFETDAFYPLCSHTEGAGAANANYSFGDICEMVGDVVIFASDKDLMAYDFKNNRVATICPLVDVKCVATDNTLSFVYCKARPDSGTRQFVKLELKVEGKVT